MVKACFNQELGKLEIYFTPEEAFEMREASPTGIWLEWQSNVIHRADCPKNAFVMTRDFVFIEDDQ